MAKAEVDAPITVYIKRETDGYSARCSDGREGTGLFAGRRYSVVSRKAGRWIGRAVMDRAHRDDGTEVRVEVHLP